MINIKKLFSRKEWFAGIVIVTLLTILAGYASLRWQYTQELELSKAKAQNHVERIYNSVADISEVTASLRTLYRVTTDFGSDELDQYTTDLVGTSSSIVTIGRYDRIMNEDLDSFADLMSERGIYQFELKHVEKGSSIRGGEIHNAVVSINPFTPGSTRLIGVDLSSSPLLADSIAQAASSNLTKLVGYPKGWVKKANGLLFLPTYAGRYTPQTIESRIAQADGGYFLELSLEDFLTHSENSYSSIEISNEILRSPIPANGGSRLLKRFFPGHHSDLTPAIGMSNVQIDIRSLDGVTISVLLKSLVWSAVALMLCLIAIAALAYNRRAEYHRQSAQRELENERMIALTTVEAINDSVFTLNAEGAVSYVNPAGEAMVNQDAESLLGSSIKSAIPFIKGEASNSGIIEIEDKLSEGKPTVLSELELSVENKTATQVDCTFTPFRGKNKVKGGVLVMRDVGQERALNKKLEHLATHDSLTGLVNRYFFELKLEEMVEGAAERGESHAICYIDMDQFKIVNDTCGHSAGDKLLIQIANHLKENCRPMDILARLGGDEFGLLIRDCDEAKCESLARRIHDTFQSFYFISGEHKFSVRACIGFVMIDRAYDHISDVLAAADIACYSAKDKGRNELHIFRSECEETSQLRGEMMMLPKLQNALSVDKFVLFVQPIAEIRPDGYDDTVKYEILLRMEDDNGSLITPFRLISAAERYNLMKQVDRWVINRALHEIASLIRIYGSELPMFSINLSGQSVMDSDLISYIIGKFAQTKVPPQNICFEITETSAMCDMNRAVALLEFLHDIGCKVALDDFGAGECSFGYLKSLPVDYLKVDGQFVKDVDTCEVHKEMLRFVQRVATILEMKTVAEFVENESILDCLREMKIDYAQGYHVSKPFNIAELKLQDESRKAA